MKTIPTYDMSLGLDGQDLIDHYMKIAPIAKTPVGTYQVFRYADAERIMTDGSTRQVEKEFIQLQGINEGPIDDFYENTVIMSNGETHRNRRKPMTKTFSMRAVKGIRHMLTDIAEEVIDPLSGEVDFMNDIAGRIPTLLMAKLLNLPVEDIETFQDRAISCTRIFSAFVEDREKIEDDLRFLNQYVVDALKNRKGGVSRDIITDLCEAEGLSEDEIRIQIVTLILGGLDTARISMCSTLDAVLKKQNIPQWEIVTVDPIIYVRDLVDEGLRYNPPIVSIPRVSTRDIDIEGYIIPEGSVVGIQTLGLSRDTSIYKDPEVFDIFRQHPKWHPAFGFGVHRCVGEFLARAELEEAFVALSKKKIEIIKRPVLSGFQGVRRIDGMTVNLS